MVKTRHEKHPDEIKYDARSNCEGTPTDPEYPEAHDMQPDVRNDAHPIDLIGRCRIYVLHTSVGIEPAGYGGKR